MKRTRTYRGPARGFDASGNRKVCIAFEPDQFDRINAHAKAANLSFAEAVRSLICFAFDRLAADEAAAPPAPDTPVADDCTTCHGKREVVVAIYRGGTGLIPDGPGFVQAMSFDAITAPCPSCTTTTTTAPERPGGA